MHTRHCWPCGFLRGRWQAGADPPLRPARAASSRPCRLVQFYSSLWGRVFRERVWSHGPTSHAHFLPHGVGAGVRASVDTGGHGCAHKYGCGGGHRCAHTDATWCAVRLPWAFPDTRVVSADPHVYTCRTQACSPAPTCTSTLCVDAGVNTRARFCPAPVPPRAWGMRAAGQDVPCAPSWARPLCSQRFPGRGAAVASCVPPGDVLLLLCAAQQWQVFLAERTEEWQLMGGVNTDRLEPLQGEPNPVPNFIHCRWASQRPRGSRGRQTHLGSSGTEPGRALPGASPWLGRAAEADPAAEGPPGSSSGPGLRRRRRGPGPRVTLRPAGPTSTC